MSVLTVRVTKSKNQEWDEFVLDLAPWERHWLLKGGMDLQLYDAWVHGDMSLNECYEVCVLRDDTPPASN